MTENQYLGMLARSAGKPETHNPNPSGSFAFNEWRDGFRLMDTSINSMLSNARQMIDGLREVRRQSAGAVSRPRVA